MRWKTPDTSSSRSAGTALLHYGSNRLLVRLNAGRKPERSPSKSAHLVTGTMLKGRPTESPHDSREITEVYVWIGYVQRAAGSELKARQINATACSTSGA